MRIELLYRCMKCRIDLQTFADRPFWIDWAQFNQYVNQADLACRDSQVIEDFYRTAWFEFRHKQWFFNPPAFYLKQGSAFFINGRHRSLLLSRHLPLVPMSLTQVDQESKAVLSRINRGQIALTEVFELPDLPMREINGIY